MNEYLALAKEWWSTLQASERLYLIGGGGALLIVLLWGLIWDPLTNSVENLGAGLITKQEDLSWMQKAATQIQAMQGSSPANRIGNQSLLALLEVQISSLGLKPALQRMNPEGRSQVKFWINGGSFDQLIKLFGQLEQDFGVKVTALSVSATEQEGLVDARVTVVRGGS